MLKERLLISEKQAERLLYDMAKFSDNQHALKTCNNRSLQIWLRSNGYKWKDVVKQARNPSYGIPLLENILGYEWSIITEGCAGVGITVTVDHYGYEVGRLEGSGQISIFDYHTKYVEALKTRHLAIKRSDYMQLLTCATYGIASIESYINGKARVRNEKYGTSFPLTDNIKLDEKLDQWVFGMVGVSMKGYDTPWQAYQKYKKLNNKIFKHNTDGSHASSYNDMVPLINDFRQGIAKFLFEMHMLFNDPVPSKIIRGMYLPDVYC